MEKKSFLKTTAGKVIIAAAVLVVVAGIVVTVLLMNGNTYRSIIAKSVTGTVIVVGEINNGQAYPGERLYGGDDVSVMAASSLAMLMDNDKYLLAEENTHFVLRADNASESSRIRIVLDKGSELNELRSSLGASDSYDVDTPNSTMSVRGTKFNVTVYTEGDVVYTLLEVTNGVVLAQLRTVGGDYTGVEQKFGAGESVLIRGGKDFSEFVADSSGETVRHLDYTALPAGGTDRLIALLGSAEDIPVPGAGTDTAVVTDAPVTDNVPDTTEDTTVPSPSGALGLGTGASGNMSVCAEGEHKFGAWYTTKLPGCENEGTEARICSVCHKMETRVLPAEGHKFGSWSVKTPAGCETEGVETRKCSVCKLKERRSIPATGHRYGEWVTTKTVCDAEGTRTRTCSVCGNQEIKPSEATGHTFGEWTVTKEAGCETTGSKSRTCSVCGFKETKAVPAAGHKYGSWVLTEKGSCVTAGTETRTCSVCGGEDTRTTTVSGHTFGEWVVTKEAGCETDGKQARTCMVCGYREEKWVVATGHRYGPATTITQASCTSEGVEERVCTVCGHKETVTTPALGHKYEKGSYDPDSNGYVWTCLNCGDYYVEKANAP